MEDVFDPLDKRIRHPSEATAHLVPAFQVHTIYIHSVGHDTSFTDQLLSRHAIATAAEMMSPEMAAA